MTYTQLAVLGVVLAVLLDLVVLRTRVLLTARWWCSYAIIVVFQLLTNGWLTGRGIVRYDPDTIVGGADPVLLGQGRIVYAPFEDLLFGAAMVLSVVMAWELLGRRRSGLAGGRDVGELDEG